MQHSLDKYRIMALQKMLAVPDLRGEIRDLTVAMLRKSAVFTRSAAVKTAAYKTLCGRKRSPAVLVRKTNELRASQSREAGS
jgi:hypothetical protein